MKNSVKDNLDEALGVALTVKPEVEMLAPKQTLTLRPPQSGMSDLEADYAFLRSTFYQVINNSVQDHQRLSDIAGETNEPRAYEVVSMMLKSIADTSKEMMNLHKMMKELRPFSDESDQSGLTTAELLKAVEGK